MNHTIPWNVSFNNVDVWFQDEAGFGQQNTTSQLWAETGTRPRELLSKKYQRNAMQCSMSIVEFNCNII
jgi:hypothetical protein